MSDKTMTSWFERNGDTCMCNAYLFTHQAGAGRCKAGSPSKPHGPHGVVGYYARIRVVKEGDGKQALGNERLDT